MLRARQVSALARRALHSSSSDAFSVPSAAWPAGVRGMDMSRAPGYQVAADEAPAPCANSRLAEFAQRHGRLERDQIANANGYLWVGPVIYPGGKCAQYTITWDVEDTDAIAAAVTAATNATETPASTPHRPAVYAKRRYTGGQARRIRQQRQDSLLRRARRKSSSKPTRKPKNDIPDDS